MAEQLNLSGLSQKIENFSAEARNQTTSFRQSASEHNRSITKFVKDIASHFTKQNGSLEDISISMKEATEASAAVSRKIDNQSSVINQSINIQSSMLNELQRMNGTLAQVVRELKDNSKTEGEGTGGGGAKGIMSSIASFFTKRNLALAGGAAAVVGGAVGGYNAGSKPNQSNQNQSFLDPKNNTDDIDPDVLKKYDGKQLPASIRLNNMGAMSIGNSGKNDFVQNMPGYVGMTPRPANEGGFYAQYATPIHGVAAASKNLENYGQKGINTPDTIVAKWTTGKPNPQYSAVLQKFLGEGVKGDTQLDLSDPSIRKKILMAKSQVESGAGKPVYKDHVFDKGVNYEYPETKQQSGQTQQQQSQPQQTPSAAPSGGGGGEQPQAQSTEKQGPTERSSPDEDKQFLQSRQVGGGSFTGVNADKLNSDFVHKLVEGIKFAEKASGEKIGITEGYRTPETQAQYYANYVKHPIEYQGKTYNPDPRTGSGGLAAPPGQSNHQKGMAVDISSGRAREILRANASRFGLRTLGQKDLPHFESGSGSDESSQASQGSTGRSYQTQGSMGGGGGGYGGGMAMGMQRPMMGGMGMGMNPMMGMMMGGRMGRAAGIGGLIGMGANILGNILSPREERMPSARYAPTPPPRTSRELERTAVQDKVDERKPQQTNASAPQQNTQQARQQPVNDPNKRNKVTSAKNPWADDLRKYYEKSMAS